MTHSFRAPRFNFADLKGAFTSWSEKLLGASFIHAQAPGRGELCIRRTCKEPTLDFAQLEGGFIILCTKLPGE